MKFSSLFGIFCIAAFCVVHVYTVDTTNELEFKLVGQERLLPYETFQGLPDDICTNLTTLNLQYLEFDPNKLVQSLQDCNELKEIRLDNVAFLNQVTRKVELPKLKAFSLNMYSIGANTEGELLDHLFFFKYEDGETISETSIFMYSPGRDGMKLSYNSYQQLDITNMKYDITKYFNYNRLVFKNSLVDYKTTKVNNLITLTLFSSDYGNGLFETLKSAYSLTQLTVREPDKVNHPRQLIDLSIFPSIEDLTELVIENVDIWSSKLIQFQDLQTLHLINCEFNSTLISVIYVSNSVYSLELKQVRHIGEDLNTFMSRLHEIARFELDYTGIPGGQKIDLTSLPESLHEMKFSGMQIQISSSHIQFFSVQSLTFIECGFDENIVIGFDSIFPNLFSVVFYQNNLSYSVLQGILNSSVLIVNLIPRKFEIPEITKFLKDSGVPSEVLRPRLVRSEPNPAGATPNRRPFKPNLTILYDKWDSNLTLTSPQR